MCALTLIPLMEYDVLFPSILVKSLLLGLIEDGSLFTTHSVALPWDCSFLSRVFSSIPFSLSACLKNICVSSLTSEDVVVTSVGVVCTPSRILRQIFYVALSSSQARSSAAVLTEPTLCAMLKLNWTNICMLSPVMVEELLSEWNV